MLSGPERAIFDFKRVFVVLSNICNCRCIMCNNRHHSLGRSSLTFADVQRVARFALRNGAEVLDFSGGEPFQFPHIAQLIREFGSSDMALNIVTNGTIMTKEHLDAVADARSLRLQVSTHGLGAVEDSIKCRSSASRQVDKTLKMLTEASVSISLATVVQKENLHQLVDIYRHFSGLPYTHHSFVMYEPIGDTTAGYIDPAQVRIRPEQAEELQRQMTTVIDEARADGNAINLDGPLVEKYVERILSEWPEAEPHEANALDMPAPETAAPAEEHHAASRDFSHPGLLCTIPRRNLFIDHNGDVMPCFHFDWKALNSNCNIAGTAVEDLVFSPEYLDMILTAIGPGGCPGCDAACYIWDPDFRRRATQPNKDDQMVALLARRPHAVYAVGATATPDPEMQSALTRANARASYLDQALRTVEQGSSWRLTAPLRRLRRALRRPEHEV